MTGGRYFRARDTTEFAEIYTILDALEPAESDERGFRPITELFYWPLGAARRARDRRRARRFRDDALAVVARRARRAWQGGLDHG